MKIYTSSWEIDKEIKESMKNVVVNEAIERYKVHLRKKGLELGAATEFHIRKELRKKTYVSIEAELKISFKEIEKIY